VLLRIRRHNVSVSVCQCIIIYLFVIIIVINLGLTGRWSYAAVPFPGTQPSFRLGGCFRRPMGCLFIYWQKVTTYTVSQKNC